MKETYKGNILNEGLLLGIVYIMNLFLFNFIIYTIPNKRVMDMLMTLCMLIIYVFFIYGVIEFFKKVYLDFNISNNKKKEREIQILIEDIEDLEYTIRTLKSNFQHIIVIVKEDNKETIEILETLKKNISIDIKYLKDLKEVKKSL
ncbi:MAG: hypothetical protein FH753_14200 [Firmicutes bacterium]|nr:hypothetical protein [Bacillota bacterium]